MSSTMDMIDVLSRWGHLMGVIIWMGHNLANVVQNPYYKPASPTSPLEEVGKQFEKALKREHGIFRYASLVVLATGTYMLWYRDILADVLSLKGEYAILGIGVWVGVLMMLNLWFVLWPHQKKVIGFVPAPLEERIRCSRITFLSSRTNSMLAFPAVFFMGTGGHGLTVF
ncbi:MAG: hypothetical protein OQJ97_12720 [Rhodospirillales bacterium]|nr:hypothetical protein [Rhodospirillales bacterium]